MGCDSNRAVGVLEGVCDYIVEDSPDLNGVAAYCWECSGNFGFDYAVFSESALFLAADGNIYDVDGIAVFHLVVVG